jgi:hypothetical protein
MEKYLTPDDVLRFVNDADQATLHTPANEQFDIISAEYIGNSHVFHAENGEVIKVSDIKTARRSLNSIYISAETGDYTLTRDYEESDFMLDDGRVKYFLNRASEIEKYINDHMEISEDSKFRVYVRLRSEIEHDEEAYMNGGTAKKIYRNYFEVEVCKATNMRKVTYLRNIYVPLYACNKEAFKYVTNELLRNLLPVDQRYDHYQ